MKSARLEWRVGLFVAVGLVLLAGLLIQFSKGISVFTETYELRLRTRNVGGIQRGAVVLMAGVPVGSVAGTTLDPEGKSVTIRLEILKEHRIHRDALFAIEQSGFLGDQYISVVPRQNAEPLLEHNDEVTCDEAFNLAEVARSAAGLLQRVDQTAQRLNDAVGRIDRLLLSEATLTNLTTTISNLRTLSERGLATLDSVDSVIQTNAPAVRLASSNLVLFSAQLNSAATDLHSLVTTNRDDITAAVKNVESASLAVKQLLDDLQAGRGLAGNLLKNEELATQLGVLSSNLAVTSSNLNKRGLWGILWKAKETKGK